MSSLVGLCTHESRQLSSLVLHNCLYPYPYRLFYEDIKPREYDSLPLSLNRFLDPSSPSMRKGRGGGRKKTGKNE